jgi:hypothetical protein
VSDRELRGREGEEVEQLAKRIEKTRGTSSETRATLTTDDRVFARITDGIYRQPSSAIRELISNAYDADATLVTIRTNAPKFDRILVRDNGNGMGADALANLIRRIGGSYKRTISGAEAGITDPGDPTRSPHGRKLIGKIGIGLFSVSQLTQRFEIITKRAGENTRLIASVHLKTYTEDELVVRKEKDGVFETGDVVITWVPADDIDAQGTDIVLFDLREQARRILRSDDRWEPPDPSDTEETTKWKPPLYHIGSLEEVLGTLVFRRPASLPWGDTDTPQAKFKRLVDAVISELRPTRSPELRVMLDNYLEMLWNLGLACPLDYVEVAPFDLTGRRNISYFALASGPKGKATAQLLGEKTVAEHFGIKEQKHALPFKVTVDDVELFRPIVFRNMATEDDRIRTPMMFVGSFDDDLRRFNSSYSGGALKFDAYLYWTNKVVPKEHNGVLIRINGASGTLFDPTFLRYQVSELTRLKQISAEIFVRKGLDAALNIDRESFNFAHPHYQILTRWLHKALKQVTNTLKGLEKRLRDERRVSEYARTQSEVRGYAEGVWLSRRSDELGTPPQVKFAPEGQNDGLNDPSGAICFDNFAVAGLSAAANATRLSDEAYISRLAAIVILLDAYELLELLPDEDQQSLISHIAHVLNS